MNKRTENRFREPEPQERPALSPDDWKAFDAFIRWAQRCGHHAVLTVGRNFEKFARRKS